MQLSLTPGGPPLSVPYDCTVNGFMARIADFSPGVTAEGYIGPATYLASITGSIRHHAACGDSLANAVVDSGDRLISSGISFVTNPKNAIASAYPA